jgi:hypothetical protein
VQAVEINEFPNVFHYFRHYFEQVPKILVQLMHASGTGLEVQVLAGIAGDCANKFDEANEVFYSFEEP